MKLAALTFGAIDCASSYYRIFQLREPLSRLGVSLTAAEAGNFTDWASLSSVDAVIVQKKLFPPHVVRRLRRLSKRLVYDTDDAIWNPHGKTHHWWTRLRTEMRLRAIINSSDVCMAANNRLRSELLQRCKTARVEVAAMFLEEAIWTRREPSTAGSSIRLGWAGAPVNLSYYYQLVPVMQHLAARNKNITWVVYSGQPPVLPDGLPVEHIPFQMGTEAPSARTFDIGLLPLPANDFAHGKSPIKMVQYMASGVPFVSDPASGAEELMGDSGAGFIVRSPDEWKNALTRLIDDVELRAKMGAAGRTHFEKNHSTGHAAKRLVALLESIGQSSEP